MIRRAIRALAFCISLARAPRRPEVICECGTTNDLFERAQCIGCGRRL